MKQENHNGDCDCGLSMLMNPCLLKSSRWFLELSKKYSKKRNHRRALRSLPLASATTPPPPRPPPAVMELWLPFAEKGSWFVSTAMESQKSSMMELLRSGNAPSAMP